MGFYIRKSVRVGPLRFNFSKSGVGVSAGIRGLRLGTEPRGNYVHVGRAGLYYRATLSSYARPQRDADRPEPGATPLVPAGTHEPLVEIESAEASQFVDSTSADLLAELSEKRRRMRLGPMAVVLGGGLLALGLFAEWPIPSLASAAVIIATLAALAFYRDVMTKTVVLMYDLDAEVEQAFEALHRAAALVAGSVRVWHIAAEGKVRDKKYHAGASNLVRRAKTFVDKREPPFIKMNVAVIAIGVGRQTIYLLPDRALVYDASGVGAVDYRNLNVQVNSMNFVETEAVPSDAQVVDQTWKYVNKKGGPDRRFKDNRQLPVCRYEEISLTSATGLNELLQVSRAGVGQPLLEALRAMAARLPTERAKAKAATQGAPLLLIDRMKQ